MPRAKTGDSYTRHQSISMMPPVKVGGRGSGKTYDQIRALPDGGVYVVGHVRDERLVKAELVAQGRQSNAIRVVALGHLDKLAGLNAPMDMDHYAREVASVKQLEEFALLNRWRRFPAGGV